LNFQAYYSCLDIKSETANGILAEQDASHG